MNTRFKSALNQIKAEEPLVSKTEAYLRDAIKKNQLKVISDIKIIKFNSARKLITAICTVVLMIGGSTGIYAYYTPVSYLSFDINPSVELGINTFGKIVSAEGYNSDGQTVLNGIKIKGESVAEASKKLVSSFVDNGFIAADGSTVISVTTESDDEDEVADLQAEAEAGVNEALNEGRMKAVIIIENISLSMREEAKALGITAGKLNLIKKLQAVDSSAYFEQYKNASIKDILQDIDEKDDQIGVYQDEETEKDKDDRVLQNSEDEAVENSEDEAVENSDDGIVEIINESGSM